MRMGMRQARQQKVTIIKTRENWHMHYEREERLNPCSIVGVKERQGLATDWTCGMKESMIKPRLRA